MIQSQSQNPFGQEPTWRCRSEKNSGFFECTVILIGGIPSRCFVIIGGFPSRSSYEMYGRYGRLTRQQHRGGFKRTFGETWVIGWCKNRWLISFRFKAKVNFTDTSNWGPSRSQSFPLHLQDALPCGCRHPTRTGEGVSRSSSCSPLDHRRSTG